MKNIILNRIKERITNATDYKEKFEIIGLEIRYQRNKLMLTQDALSKDICSLSYLCKIETGQIDPNNEYLREICQRLDLSEEKIDALLNSKEILEEALKAFLNNDLGTLNKCYESINNLENYRCQIIKFIYFLANKNIAEACKLNYLLMTLTKNMGEFDFIIFSLFSSILQYYNCNFKEAYEVLIGLNKFELSLNSSILKDIFIHKISYALNKSDFPIHYMKLRFNLVDNGFIELYDEARYMLCLYYLKNDCMEFLKDEINSLIKPLYKNTINLLLDFKNKNISNISKYDDNELSAMARLIKLYVFDRNKFKDIVERFEYNYYIYDLDLLYLLSISHNMDDDYEDYLFRELIPRAGYTDDLYIKQYLIEELFKLYDGAYTSSRSKNIIRAHFLLYGVNTSDFELDENKENYKNFRGVNK